MLETVPGMVISQHSGEGKANQYYLRGFNLDHGTDFSTTVAGVPVNTPTGAHAHGYADISFLIPELVSGVQYKKGPYYAEEGDFSAAGAANINYVNQLDRPAVSLSAGNDGWRRLFTAASPRIGDGFLLAALELNHNDGPWVRPDDYEKVNGVLRYSRGDNRNGFSLTGMGYWANWESTDQVAERAVSSGLIPRFGHLDPTDSGTTNRQSLAAEYQRSAGPSSLRATGFVLHNSLNLFSNFTYFLDDPVHGDQFEQAEQRTAAGGRVTYRRLGHFYDRHTESAIGVQLRRDWLSPVGLYHTEARERLSTTREDRVGQTMASVYGQTEIEWTRALRTTFGMRADTYQFSVTSNSPLNSGDGVDAMVSPKFGAVFGPWSGTELYANAGMGFHSNDARGAVIRSRSRQRRVRRSRDAAGSCARRGSGPAYGEGARTPVDGRALVSRSRFRTGLRRRCRHDRSGTSKPSCRLGVDQLREPPVLADARRRPRVDSCAVRRRRPGGDRISGALTAVHAHVAPVVTVIAVPAPPAGAIDCSSERSRRCKSVVVVAARPPGRQ